MPGIDFSAMSPRQMARVEARVATMRRYAPAAQRQPEPKANERVVIKSETPYPLTLDEEDLNEPEPEPSPAQLFVAGFKASWIAFILVWGLAVAFALGARKRAKDSGITSVAAYLGPDNFYSIFFIVWLPIWAAYGTPLLCAFRWCRVPRWVANGLGAGGEVLQFAALNVVCTSISISVVTKVYGM